MSQSTIRTLVDEALKTRNTTLQDFITDGVAEGKSLTTLYDDLRFLTGIPVSSRTIMRWSQP